MFTLLKRLRSLIIQNGKKNVVIKEDFSDRKQFIHDVTHFRKKRILYRNKSSLNNPSTKVKIEKPSDD